MIKRNTILGMLFFLAIVASYSSACTKDKLPEPMAGSECETLDATYNGSIKAIVDASCAVTGCHVAGGGAPGNFTSYDGLSDFANNGPSGFRDRVINLRNDPEIGMPPDWSTSSPGDLTEEQFDIFRCWADSGYPEN